MSSDIHHKVHHAVEDSVGIAYRDLEEKYHEAQRKLEAIRHFAEDLISKQPSPYDDALTDASQVVLLERYIGIELKGILESDGIASQQRQEV